MAKVYTKAVLVTAHTHEDLDCLKKIPQEPYGAVIDRLVKFYCTHGSKPRELEDVTFVQ